MRDFDSEEEAPKDIEKVRITQIEATKILDAAIRYIEMQEDALDAWLFKRFDYTAAMKRYEFENRRKP